jgi:hypothetical protein
MRPKPRYYAVTDIKCLQFLLHSRITALAMHWAFQNMLNMDRTELLFKLTIDLVLTVVFSLGLSTLLAPAVSVLLGFLFAHTLNFLFNGQIFVVLKHFGDVSHELPEHTNYMETMRNRMRQEPSIRWAAAYGSIARGELRTTSDLDARLIREPGFRNGLQACWFALRERAIAFRHHYPLDILVLDSPRLLARMRADEPPMVLHDTTSARR